VERTYSLIYANPVLIISNTDGKKKTMAQWAIILIITCSLFLQNRRVPKGCLLRNLVYFSS